jgi:hypothetical protein
MPNIPLAQRLVYSTIKINCKCQGGKIKSGTGFFFSNEHNQWLIVTNWDVVRDSISGQFVITEGDKNNEPIPGPGINVHLDNFSQRWIHHSDPNIDLCALNLMGVVEECRRLEGYLFLLK